MQELNEEVKTSEDLTQIKQLFNNFGENTLLNIEYINKIAKAFHTWCIKNGEEDYDKFFEFYSKVENK